MIIRFLGTGTSQGIPIIACNCPVCSSQDPRDKRLRASVYFHTGNHSVVIDAGPDFREQMLRYKINTLDAILLTHGHRDHIAGLDDVRAYNWFQKKPMDVYAEEQVLRQVETNFFYAFAEDKYPGIPEINTHIIENTPFFIGTDEIVPVRGYHLKLPVLGFRIKDFAYLTDMNQIDENEKQKLKGTRILVVNALRKRKHISHFNLEEALELIREIKPEQAYFTRISDQMGLHGEISEELPENVALAWDGLELEL